MTAHKFILIVVLIATSGCSTIYDGYDGAIYTSYDQFDLGIRSAPETATPVKINFGREHSVVSFVPRRDSANRGEAVSLFATSDTQTITLKEALGTAQAHVKAAAEAAKKSAEEAEKAAVEAGNAAGSADAAAVASKTDEAATTTKETNEMISKVVEATEDAQVAAKDQDTATAASLFSDSTLVKAQGRFATGNAAKVLVIPQNKKVVIKDQAGNKADSFTITTTPEERVIAAFAPTTRFPTQAAADFNKKAKSVSACSNPDVVYNQAGADLGSCFQAYLQQIPAGNLAFRFDIARAQYLANCRGASKADVNNALEESIAKNCK